MKRESCILGALTPSLFVLLLQVSGQGTQPTLQEEMNFIANSLNRRGTISWTETIPDLFGASYAMNSNLIDINANPSECSLKWTNVYTSSDDKMVETYLVNLGTVSNVGVEPYSQYRKSDFQFKLEVSPETYAVVVKTDAPLQGNRESYHKSKLKSKKKLSNEARLLFSDDQTANAVSDRIRHAAKICRATRSGL